MIPQNPQKVKGAVSFIHIKGAPKSAFWTHFLPFTVCSWLSLHSRFFTSSNRLTAWPQTQFERKVKNASQFFVASQKIQYLFRIVYKISIFYLSFSHRNLFAFTETARNWHTPSREHDVHTAQISSSIFYVFANCTNFHFCAILYPFGDILAGITDLSAVLLSSLAFRRKPFYAVKCGSRDHAPRTRGNNSRRCKHRPRRCLLPRQSDGFDTALRHSSSACEGNFPPRYADISSKSGYTSAPHPRLQSDSLNGPRRKSFHVKPMGSNQSEQDPLWRTLWNAQIRNFCGSCASHP